MAHTAPRTSEGEQIVTGEILSIGEASRADASWVMGQVRTDDGATVIPFVGADLLGCETGCAVRLVGFWEESERFGWQFRASRVESRLPVRSDAIERFLAAHVQGCGPTRARKIVNVLGAESLDLLAARPEVVREIFSGKVGEKLEEATRSWAESYQARRRAQGLEVALMGAGMTRRLALRVLNHFRRHKEAEDVVLRHPYRLVAVPGIGFRKADQIARHMGVAKQDPSRISAGVVYAMETWMATGHSACPREKLVSQARSALEIEDTDAVEAAVDRGLEAGMLIQEGDLVFLGRVLHTERRVVERVVALLAQRRSLTASERERVAAIIAESGLTETQGRALWMALESGLAILTGRPGSGKTFTTRTFVRCCKALRRSVQVAAPTGKAAARAAEVTGIDAKTIHRLIGLQQGEVGDPIDADVIILDETSMADLDVGDWLLRNIDPQRTSVLLVGDNNQLPSVGHGRLLGDLIDSACVPSVELVEIHRQGKGSRIIENAHRLLDGQPLLTEHDPQSDFWFADITQEESVGPDGFPLPYDPEKSQREQKVGQARLRRAIEYLVRDRGAVPVRDIQVLSPMRRGLLGVDSLNEELQQALNPHGKKGPYIGGGVRVRTGDRVIQTRNDYSVPRGLFNGEQGEVLEVRGGGDEIVVRFSERDLALSGAQLSNLRLAWAITVHRSQGSEFRYTLMTYHTSHYQMLDRAILYTGLTRARQMFILIGSYRAIELTQRQGRRAQVRFTGLVGRLRRRLAAAGGARAA